MSFTTKKCRSRQSGCFFVQKKDIVSEEYEQGYFNKKKRQIYMKIIKEPSMMAILSFYIFILIIDVWS